MSVIVTVDVMETRLLLRISPGNALSRAAADRVRSSGIAYSIGYRNGRTVATENAGRSTLLKSSQREGRA